MRGVSLDEIAESTKIGTRLLKALEDEQFDLLPGGIFNKGFVRAYAKYLGMDEEQAVADYLQAAGNGEPDVQLIAQQSDHVEYKYAEASSSASRGFPFFPVLVLLVVVAVGFGGWKLYQQHVDKIEAWRAEREASAPPSSTTVSPQAAPSDAGQASNAQPSPGTTNPQPLPSSELPAAAAPANTSPAAASGFDVVVKTTGKAWVSLKVDGKILVRGVLDADQVKPLHANEEIVVWTGNAGVTEVSFDGKSVPVGGGVNEAKVLVFKPSGLQPAQQPVRPAAQIPSQPAAEPSPTPQ
jgi:cytoskeleton protein RodZ